MPVELRRRSYEVEMLDPSQDFAPTAIEAEMRWDPLTGQGVRLLPPSGMLPETDVDLQEIAEQTRGSCPFCAERVEQVTPKFPRAVWPEGRVRQGEALLFPNLMAYARWSGVSVYSPERHFLLLSDMNDTLVSDNLRAQVTFLRAVTEHDPEAAWCSINANHFPPSGSSIFHPHMQGTAHPEPTTMQRQLAETPPDRLREYVEVEREEKARYLGSTGRVEWLASFAPVGPLELRAFVFEVASPTQLDDELIDELGHGISTALGLYAEMGFDSFNLAMLGAPPDTSGYPLNLRMVCRSNPRELYRSDVTWLERLHLEAAVDVWPEEVAEKAGDRFRS